MDMQLDTVWQTATDIYSKYLDLDGSNASFVFQLLYLNHSFVVANMTFKLFKQFPHKNERGEVQFPLVAGVLMMLVTGLGGAIINAVILGEQQIFLSQDIFLVYFLLAWALTIYSPFYIVHHITGNVIVEFFTYAAEGYFVAQTLMGGVDKGVRLFPGKNVAPIVIGILSAIGGSILKPFFGNLYLGHAVLTSELSKPSKTGFMALISSIAYFFGHHNGLASQYVVKISPTITLTFDIVWVVRIAYIFFFLLLWLQFSFLPMFARSPEIQFPSTGNPKIASHEKEVRKEQVIGSKPSGKKTKATKKTN